MNTLAERLRWARRTAGISKRGLCDVAGLDPSHVRAIETGDRGKRLSADTALNLGRALGCTVEWLINGEGAPPSPEAVRAAVARARDRSADHAVADTSPRAA